MRILKPTRITLKRLTTFLFGLLLFSSCEQDAFFDVENGHTKLYAFSEITTSDKIKVVVNVAPGLNTDDKYFYPKQADAQVTLLKDGKVLEDPGFRYISREKAFISQGSFRPEPGVEYGLHISLKKDTEIESITASTIIPQPNFIDKYLLETYNTTQVNKDSKELEINLDVALNETEHRYFIMKPFFRNDLGERENLLVKEVREGKEGCYNSSFSGLLVNSAKVQGDISLTLVSEHLVPINSDISEINFELLTITEDAYNYYRSFAKQMVAQSVSLAEPVISYSNFENGLGLFTGFSSTINTIKL